MKTEDLAEKLRSGALTPDEALKKFELPGRHISEIECSFESEPLPCGFREIELNNYLRKQRPDLSIVAARPGHGKTSFACQVAMNVSIHAPVLVFSLEMTASSLKERLLAVKLNMPIKEVQRISKGDLAEANAALAAHKLIIDDTNGLHINTLVSRAKAQHAASPLALIVVDYVQIIAANAMRSKAEEVSLIAERLKTLAKDLNVPILALAQNNRNIEGRSSYIDYKSGELKYAANARPQMSDLADSAGIEKWADMVCFIQRQYLVDRTRPGEADFFVVKNRNGLTDDFVLQFSGDKTAFYDMPNKEKW